MSPRSRIILGAALAALVAVALLVPGKQRSADYTAGSVPRSAAAFVDSIGVVTHLQYRSTAYARQDEVLRRLRESGIRNLREAAPVNAPELEKGLRAAALFGVRGTLGFGLDVNPQVGVGAGVRAMGDAVAAFEGPNEVDTSGPPDWPARLKTFMPALRAAVRAQAGAGTPVVGPSFVNASLYRNVDPGTFDVANLHPYPGGLPPEPVFEAQRGRGLELAPGKKLAFTEIGYHNALTAKVGQPPASEQAAAVYLPRALLWAFAHHVDRTFVYELLDEQPEPGLTDPEQHFGLLRNDLSPKPAFLAIRNLIRAVTSSPGPALEPPPGASVQAPVRLERLDLERADGSRVIALWRPAFVWDRDGRRDIVPPAARVTIAWPRPVHDVTATRPTAGAEPVERRAQASRVGYDLGGDVLLLSYR